ncbi:MAG: protein translocase subunit SecD [Patescibacteria group bacterium]|nr:protein translocase subunit SecD [Patescibacteria group bacterium]
MNKKIYLNILAIILLTLVAGAVASPKMPDFNLLGKPVGQTLRELKIKLGLDLQGGAHLVYRADMSSIPSDSLTESLSGIRDVIERRVNAYGVSEPQILTNKSGEEYRIIVDLAGVTNVEAAIAMIGETPVLDFREENDEEALQLTPEEQEIAKETNQQSKTQAEAILGKALDGEDFAKLAQENSADVANKDQGGDLGFFGKEAMVPEFEEVAFNKDFTKDSVWPNLVQTQFGYHLLKKTDEREIDGQQEVKISHILFKTVDETKKEVATQPFKLTPLTGKNLKQAAVIFNQNTQEPQVSLQFDDEGKKMFREITERNVGKRLAIFLDGAPITVPVVQTVIADGRAVITGSGDITEAKELAKRLNAGALPVPIELISQEKVGASLGASSLKKSLTAGLLGISLVSGFMLTFYLICGLVAVISLSFYAVAIVAVFKILGITLTLSGIAGFILSVGMAVDANILIFGRIKEELKEGRSVKLAISNGFKRAWPSIRDGNISTLITCVVLTSLGTGMVKGFAITLGIGITLSMFTAVFVTRNILEFLEIFLKDKLVIGFKRKK